MEEVHVPWWYQYRHAKNRPRHQLSLEMILRKSFTDVLKDYSKHCSIAGIKCIRERDIPIRHRLMWSLLLCASIGATIYMLMNIYSATLSNPLVVTMDSSTYSVTNIDFPGVAICNVNRISMKMLKYISRRIYSNRPTKNKTLDDIEWYFLQSGRLLDYSYNETLRIQLNGFRTYAKTLKYGVRDGMEHLAPKCDEMLLRCSWGGRIVNCTTVFNVRRTTLGHCCAFNYAVDYDSDRPSRAKNYPKKVERQEHAGPQHGLVVILDPLVEDYAYPLRPAEGFDILLFDATHYADPSAGRVLQRMVQPEQAMVLELQSVKQVASEEVRTYPLSVRKCLFNDELPEVYGKMYSYSACIARCKYKTIRSLCKCTPYFLPMAGNEVPECSLADLPCLNKYKEKLLNMFPFYATSNKGLELELIDSLYCQECMPDCEFTKHSTKSNKIPIVNRNLGNKADLPLLTRGLNESNICMLYIFQGTKDGVLDRLDIVSYWYEILSNVGGFAGMLVGFSIINIVEFIYYFIVRFIMVFCTNCKLYY